jgi:two-component system, NarL family, response regulator DegU
MMPEVTILVVDDHPVFRRGLYDVIGKNSRFRIVGEASDGEEALRLVINLKPDIAIIDIDMPRLNGLETVRSLRKLALTVTTVFLTMYKEEDMFNAAMDLGARAYVLKENAANDILAALEKVALGETFVSPLMLDAGQRRSARVHELLLSKPQIEDLTPTERRILKLVGEDRTSKEIAEYLKVSVRTVENHRQNICKKLNLHGTHSLLKFAFDNSSYL